MMLWHNRNTRTQANIFRARQHGGDKEIIRQNGFPSHRVMLADPHLCKPKLVSAYHHFDVFLKTQCAVLLWWMQRHHKEAEFHGGFSFVKAGEWRDRDRRLEIRDQ